MCQQPQIHVNNNITHVHVMHHNTSYVTAMNTKCVCCAAAAAAAAARMSYTVFLHSNVLFLRSNVVSLRSSVSSLLTSVLSLQRSVLRRKMLRRHTMLRREKLLSTMNNVFFQCAVIRHGWQETKGNHVQFLYTCAHGLSDKNQHVEFKHNAQ